MSGDLLAPAFPALDDGRRRQTDPLADLRQGHFAVLLQQGEDLQVDLVQVQLLFVAFHGGAVGNSRFAATKSTPMPNKIRLIVERAE